MTFLVGGLFPSPLALVFMLFSSLNCLVILNFLKIMFAPLYPKFHARRLTGKMYKNLIKVDRNSIVLQGNSRCSKFVCTSPSL